MTFIVTINKAEKGRPLNMIECIHHLLTLQRPALFFLSCTLAKYTAAVIEEHRKRRENNSSEHIKYLISILLNNFMFSTCDLFASVKLDYMN